MPPVPIAAALQTDLDLVVLDRDVLGDDGEDLLAQNQDQVRATVAGALVGQDQLQPVAGDPGRGPAVEQVEDVEQIHAALRIRSLSMKDFLSEGTDIGTVSPLSRRAASR